MAFYTSVGERVDIESIDPDTQIQIWKSIESMQLDAESERRMENHRCVLRAVSAQAEEQKKMKEGDKEREGGVLAQRAKDRRKSAAKASAISYYKDLDIFVQGHMSRQGGEERPTTLD